LFEAAEFLQVCPMTETQAPTMKAFQINGRSTGID